MWRPFKRVPPRFSWRLPALSSVYRCRGSRVITDDLLAEHPQEIEAKVDLSGGLVYGGVPAAGYDQLTESRFEFIPQLRPRYTNRGPELNRDFPPQIRRRRRFPRFHQHAARAQLLHDSRYYPGDSGLHRGR